MRKAVNPFYHLPSNGLSRNTDILQVWIWPKAIKENTETKNW